MEVVSLWLWLFDYPSDWKSDHPVIYRNDPELYVLAVINGKNLNLTFIIQICKQQPLCHLSMRYCFINNNSYNNHPSVVIFPFPHLCCISSGSFCFLLWSTGDWELRLRDGGAPSLICSFPPSGSPLPRSVFLHFALRFWNQTCIDKRKGGREKAKQLYYRLLIKAYHIAVYAAVNFIYFM